MRRRDRERGRVGDRETLRRRDWEIRRQCEDKSSYRT